MAKKNNDKQQRGKRMMRKNNDEKNDNELSYFCHLILMISHFNLILLNYCYLLLFIVSLLVT